MCLDFRPMTSLWRVLLLFLAVLLALATTSDTHGDGNLTLRCHPDQATTLLQLKKSFFFDEATTNLSSWQDDTDCCHWEGVGCGGYPGRVTALKLNESGFYGFGLDPVIFNLTSLRFLDLSMNDIGGHKNMPTVGFERLTFLAHLNLSNSGFGGDIPIGIGKLENLTSLDLSHDTFHYSFWISDFQGLVRNLSNLRELYLDGVDISLSGEEWCNTIAKYVPRLQVLSLGKCGLYGRISQSLLNLSSLTVINLQHNSVQGFFMDLEGWSPPRIFQSKKLRVLDLSGNTRLSGSLPNFSNASSLQTLRLDDTSLSFSKPSSSSNFFSLQELALDVKFMSVDFLSSFNNLPSLSHFRLNGPGFLGELGSIFSWIGDLKNLSSLELSECDFSSTKPSTISNLKNLRSLSIGTCNLTMPILSAITNLIDLQSLDMFQCALNGPMPSSIGNFTNLRSLSISGCEFPGPIPSSFANLLNLRSLSLSNSDFSGPIPSAMGNLTNLRSLDISSCGFVGPMPSSIGNLVNLRSLSLYSYNNFGPMPSSIGNLINLISMDIEYGTFPGPMPSSIGNLSLLQSLQFYECDLSGPIPYEIGQLKELTSLILRHNNITGRIPNSVGNLTNLQILDLSGNYLKGEIPSSLYNLPLQNLDLSWNQLSGPMKEFGVASSGFKYLNLERNELRGQIPMSLFELTSLMSLTIGWNKLVGSVELTSFFRLPKLRILILSNNNLTIMNGEGNGNSFSTYSCSLSILQLASCNIAEFPIVLTLLDHVSDLDLSCNKLSGDIPNWIWERWGDSLSYLNLSHNLLTGMGLNSSFVPFSTQLDVLDLSANRLQGQIPSFSAEDLDYSHNNFSSVLPNFTLYLRSTTYLRMSNNIINGYIDDSICNYTVELLDLSYNNFSGLIPSCLIEDAGMKVLILRKNHFEGTLPYNIGSECTLQTIDLHGNKIEGKLPRALSNCIYLEVLDIGNNLIVDTFPSWIGELPNLYVLILRSNQFYGSIDDVVGHHHSKKYFSSLQIVDLASNNFSGNLNPELFGQLKSMMANFNSTGDIVRAKDLSSSIEFYQDSTVITYKGSSVTFERILTTLTAMDFANNRQEGTIPASIGRLVSLCVLNMSHNAFKGNIPSQLGGMTDLESLDLSCNQLLGDIPQELADLTFLGMLNLSQNQLVGKIPQSRLFSTFDNTSFEGNLGLCGPPLSNPCGVSPAPPSEAHVEKSSVVDVVLFLFVGLGFGIGFAAAILMRWG